MGSAFCFHPLLAIRVGLRNINLNFCVFCYQLCVFLLVGFAFSLSTNGFRGQLRNRCYRKMRDYWQVACSTWRAISERFAHSDQLLLGDDPMIGVAFLAVSWGKGLPPLGIRTVQLRTDTVEHVHAYKYLFGIRIRKSRSSISKQAMIYTCRYRDP
jgi:hypothetical protein